jgi:hypothetical protein
LLAKCYGAHQQNGVPIYTRRLPSGQTNYLVGPPDIQWLAKPENLGGFSWDRCMEANRCPYGTRRTR